MVHPLQIAYLFAVLFLHVPHLGFQVINSLIPFGNFLTQFIIGLLQLLHFPAAEKRTHSAYYDRSSIGGCTFELVRAYLLPVTAFDCPRSISRMSDAKFCISVISSSLSLRLLPVSWFIQSNTIWAW